jgi:hypothetical protein
MHSMKRICSAMSPFAGPSNLSFANHVHCFIALDGPSAPAKKRKPRLALIRRFDLTAIRLDNDQARQYC